MNFRSFFNAKTIALACALVSASGVGFALFAQYVQGLEPCPLCMLQRYLLLGAGGFFALCFLMRRRKTRHEVAGHKAAVVSLSLAGLLSATGLATSIWHVRLQYGASTHVAGCAEPTGLLALVAKTVGGSGDCAEAGWVLMGISAPAWTGAVFAGLTAGAITIAMGWAKNIFPPKDSPSL